MNIEIYGTGERMRTLASLAREISVPHLLLLPIPTAKDKVHITKTDLELSETLTGVGEGSVVVGYDIPMWYTEKARSLGARVLDLIFDGEFMGDNAYTTSLGALSYIMNSEKRQITDLSFGIVGYGRIGSRLTELLLFFGARVRVYTSREETALELCRCGVLADDGIYRGEFSAEGMDILINTAPCDLSGAFLGKSLPDSFRIIELASGENFDGVDRVERLPALPDRYYPESAARAYLRAVKRFISGGDGK